MSDQLRVEDYNSRMHRRRPIYVGLLLLVTSLSLLSQPTRPGGLRGKVTGNPNYPIRKAYILVHRPGEADRSTFTDATGLYSIKLPERVYDVMISAEGYSPVCRKVQIEPDGMMIFDATLEPNTLGMQID
jgi:hypothetical protein